MSNKFHKNILAYSLQWARWKGNMWLDQINSYAILTMKGQSL